MMKSTAPHKRPSMFEVAKKAGVSHQTVSRVINHSPDVSSATRERVLAVIEEMGYRPSNSARSLASQRSRTIGLIAGGMKFYGPITAISAIETVARSHGLFISVSMVHEARCTQSEFDELCRTFDEQDVDALVMLTPTDVMFRAACQARVRQPKVILTSTHGASGMSLGNALLEFHTDDLQATKSAIIGIDQWSPVCDIVDMLSDYGHRQILYCAGPAHWRDAATRLAAFRDRAAHHQLSTTVLQCGSWDASEAYTRMNHYIESHGVNGERLPTAVVSANDAQAVGIIRALHEHGMQVPRDMSVVGFDDMPAMGQLVPLSLIHI